jgi:hypothetical protein
MDAAKYAVKLKAECTLITSFQSGSMERTMTGICVNYAKTAI